MPEPTPNPLSTRALRAAIRAALAGLLLLLITGGAWLKLREPASPPEAEAPPQEPDPLAEVERKLGEWVRDELVAARPFSPRVDPERALARWARRAPEASRRAKAAHRPFRPAARDAHAFFEAFLARVLPLDPDWGIYLGLHPHPPGVRPVSDQARVAYLCLVRDAWRALKGLEAKGPPSPHAQVDRALLRSILEVSLRWSLESRDQEVLAWVERWFHAFPRLLEFACCPAPARRAVVLARLKALPQHLDGVPAQLRHPPRALVLSTLRRLPRLERTLEQDLAQAWAKAPPEEARAFAAARAELKRALQSLATRLRREVLPRSSARLGIGRANYELLLHRVDFLSGGRGASAVLREAALAFHAARGELRALEAPLSREDLRRATLTARAPLLAELRAQGAALVTLPAKDPGLLLRPAPSLWRAPGEDFYSPANPLGPEGLPGVLFTNKAPGKADALREIHRRLTLAREGLPGRHLRARLARKACRLRRAYDCLLAQGGWALRAEALLSEGAQDPQTRFLLASLSQLRAWVSAFEVLLHTQALPEAELLRLLRLVEGDPGLGLADLGDRAREPGLASTEFLGGAELERLERLAQASQGAAFDPRAFRTRLLRLGPVPPSLLQIELLGGR